MGCFEKTINNDRVISVVAKGTHTQPSESFDLLGESERMRERGASHIHLRKVQREWWAKIKVLINLIKETMTN